MNSEKFMPQAEKNIIFPSLRPASATDIPSLLDIENERFSSDKIIGKQFRRYLKKESIRIIVAEYENLITGYAILFLRKGGKSARLYSIASRSHNLIKGSGSCLLQEIIIISKAAGAKRLILELRADNQHALNFYKKAGFREFGSYHHYYEDDQDALRMEKSI